MFGQLDTLLIGYVIFVFATARFGARLGQLCLDRWILLIEVSCTDDEARAWHADPEVEKGRRLMFLFYPLAAYTRTTGPDILRWWKNYDRGISLANCASKRRSYTRWMAWTWSLRLAFNVLLMPFMLLHAALDFIALGRPPQADSELPRAIAKD